MKELFEKLVNLDQNVVMVIILIIFLALERLINTPHKFSKRFVHYINNIPMLLLITAEFYLIAAGQVWCFNEIGNHHIGLFNQVRMPLIIKIIAGVAAFDLGAYWMHRLAHKVDFLWRLHRVHHSDTSMDSSTYFRGHPFDSIGFAIANVVTAAVFGLSIEFMTFYFLVLIPFQIAQHSNVAFPAWVDKTFGLVFTCPNMHKAHHHRDQYYTDSNFADIFILWDRLFGTYKSVPVKDIRYGLNEFDDKRKQTFWYLLISPFVKIERVRSDLEIERPVEVFEGD